MLMVTSAALEGKRWVQQGRCVDGPSRRRVQAASRPSTLLDLHLIVPPLPPSFVPWWSVQGAAGGTAAARDSKSLVMAETLDYQVYEPTVNDSYAGEQRG